MGAERYLPGKNSAPVVREIHGQDELMQAVAQVYARAMAEAHMVVYLEIPDVETQGFFKDALLFLAREDEVRFAAADLSGGSAWVMHLLHNRSAIELRVLDDDIEIS